MARKSTHISVELDGSKLELKSIKVFEQMSDETLAFTAKAYFNGVYVGEAKNEGMGGASWIIGKWNKELFDFFKSTQRFAAKYTYQGREYMINFDEDFLLSSMVDAAYYDGSKTFSLTD